jgi:hypothetical protein
VEQKGILIFFFLGKWTVDENGISFLEKNNYAPFLYPIRMAIVKTHGFPNNFLNISLIIRLYWLNDLKLSLYNVFI